MARSLALLQELRKIENPHHHPSDYVDDGDLSHSISFFDVVKNRVTL